MVDTASPPRRMDPRPRYSSLPEPVDRTRGDRASRLVVALMNIGRMRVLTASVTASMPVRLL
jgi:hypothetical protein